MQVVSLCGCRVIRSAEVEAAGQETPTGMWASGEAGAGMLQLHRSGRPDAVTEGTAQAARGPHGSRKGWPPFTVHPPSSNKKAAI